MLNIFLKFNSFIHSNKYKYFDFLTAIIFLLLSYNNYISDNNYLIYLFLAIIALISGIFNLSQKLIIKSQETIIKKI